MKPIHKVLVANRGEIASRIIRAARDLDISTVAVFSQADADAPYVREADEAVGLHGNAPNESYLDMDQLLQAAKLSGADAVHPGYGFLSERSSFAVSCAEADLTFIGPHPDTIEAMGSKITAKELMRAAGVPVLPGLSVNPGGDLTQALDSGELEKIGFPVLIKAAYGGGGRGMRIVRNVVELASAIESAQREASSAFGDGTVFVERYLERPRHIEVQIFGDEQGTMAHLFERECSIQRRYQKVVEEAPSPAVDRQLRERLVEAAISAGHAISYVGAGTVEFVLNEDGDFYFLEVNTRLQVEHPVTELVTGLDLVKLQFLIAEGHPLPQEVLEARITGHAIEVRLYAEDVENEFVPTSGAIHKFHVPPMDGIRVDSGVSDGSVVSIHYDPMLAKIIAHAPDRLQACRKLAAALTKTEVHGVTTNRELLIGILRDPAFQSGHIDTSYLARADLFELWSSRGGEGAAALHPLAAALAAQYERRSTAQVLRGVPSGWRNVFNSQQETTFFVDEKKVCVRYGYRRRSLGDPRVLAATIDGDAVADVAVRRLSASHVDLDINGVRRQIQVHRVGDLVFVDSSLGSTVLREEVRFPAPSESHVAGSLVSPMPGTVVRTEVTLGQMVMKGAAIVVLEAMKMEHVIRAPADGIVRDLRVEAGQTVDVGVVLAVLEDVAEDPNG
jgi:propionyl-CoA carboxylase alpha chain